MSKATMYVTIVYSVSSQKITHDVQFSAMAVYMNYLPVIVNPK